MLELIFHTHSRNCIRTSGVHDWRRVAVVAVVTWYLVMVGRSAWYASLGERYATLVGFCF